MIVGCGSSSPSPSLSPSSSLNRTKAFDYLAKTINKSYSDLNSQTNKQTIKQKSSIKIDLIVG